VPRKILETVAKILGSDRPQPAARLCSWRSAPRLSALPMTGEPFFTRIAADLGVSSPAAARWVER